jgi:hypothetical protein
MVNEIMQHSGTSLAHALSEWACGSPGWESGERPGCPMGPPGHTPCRSGCAALPDGNPGNGLAAQRDLPGIRPSGVGVRHSRMGIRGVA